MPSAPGSPGWTPVPILMYHNVLKAIPSPLSRHVYVTAGEFRQQMNALKKRDYTPITFAQLLDSLSTGAILPHRPVILTFDDGYD